jgi:hypothetical protein
MTMMSMKSFSREGNGEGSKAGLGADIYFPGMMI